MLASQARLLEAQFGALPLRTTGPLAKPVLRRRERTGLHVRLLAEYWVAAARPQPTAALGWYTGISLGCVTRAQSRT